MVKIERESEFALILDKIRPIYAKMSQLAPPPFLCILDNQSLMKDSFAFANESILSLNPPFRFPSSWKMNSTFSYPFIQTENFFPFPLVNDHSCYSRGVEACLWEIWINLVQNVAVPVCSPFLFSGIYAQSIDIFAHVLHRSSDRFYLSITPRYYRMMIHESAIIVCLHVLLVKITNFLHFSFL